MTIDTPGEAEFQASSCSGKEAYRTVHLARKVLKRRLNRDKGRSMLVAYRCDRCGSYHIGSNPRTVHVRAMHHKNSAKQVR